MKIIGNHEVSFELTGSSPEKKLSNIRINIKGSLIGTFQSPTYLPGFIGALKSILEDESYFNNDINIVNYKDFF